MAKSLVTGSSGFIAGHLIKSLLECGDEVLAIDSKVPTDNLEKLLDQYQDKLKIVQGDLAYKSICMEAAEDIETIFHMAAETNLKKSVEFPQEAICDDLISTINILEAAREYHVPRVVLSSSAAIYGKYDEKPLSPYGVNKRACEMYGDVYNKLHGLSVVSLRYFNVYGPGQMNLQAVIPQFILKLLNAEKAVVYGDGSRSRDFIYVDDVVHANLFMADRPEVGQFDIGTGKSTTILELIKVLGRVTETRLNFYFDKVSEWDIPYSCSNIDKIKQLGWEPEWNLEKGLNETVKFYEEFIEDGVEVPSRSSSATL